MKLEEAITRAGWNLTRGNDYWKIWRPESVGVVCIYLDGVQLDRCAIERHCDTLRRELDSKDCRPDKATVVGAEFGLCLSLLRDLQMYLDTRVSFTSIEADQGQAWLQFEMSDEVEEILEQKIGQDKVYKRLADALSKEVERMALEATESKEV